VALNIEGFFVQGVHMTRREAREWIVRYLFQYSFFDEDNDCEEIEKFIEYHSLKGSEVEFIKNSIFGILKNREVIDQIIHDNLVNWTQERIPKTDLSILRMAIYEIKYVEEIPQKVSINEAVELSKKYGTDESFRFVNGLLGAFVRKEVGYVGN